MPVELDMPLRVVKVGGSLFSSEALPSRLVKWLEEQPPATTLLIAGGGILAQAIRGLQRQLSFGDETAHWLAIDAMRMMGSALHAALEGHGLAVYWIQGAPARERLAGQSVAVLDPIGFLQQDADSADRLPASWDVTSDSIAARVAEMLHADELVLLKSAPPPFDRVSDLADAGYVDAFFPRVIRWLAVHGCIMRLECLRAAQPRVG